MIKTYTREEVAPHNTEHDCWVVFEGKVLNLTNFLAEHPGGSEVIMDHAGKDVTQPFEDIGHTENAKALTEIFAIGNIVDLALPLKDNGAITLIKSGNWEGLAKNLKEICSQEVVNDFYTNEFNLGMKTFVDRLAVHSLKQLLDETCEQSNNLQCDVAERRTRAQFLHVQRDQLRKHLDEVEAELSTVDARIKQYDAALAEKKQIQANLTGNIKIFQSSLEKNEPALQQWQHRLNSDISSWNVDNVVFLLSEIGLQKYATDFLNNKIDGSVLAALDTNELTSTLKLSFKDAKRLLMYVHLVQTHHDIYTIPPGVLQWNTETVGTWLEDNKFAHLVDTFKKNQITGAELAFLDKADLTTHLKIQALGDVIKLQKEISKLKESLRDDQILQERLKSSNENGPNENELARQLEELKKFNSELKSALNEKETKIPDAFMCPITQDMMQEPVVASDGHTYEKTAIELWLQNHNTSPMTGLQLSNKQLTPSHTLKSMIREFIDANKKK